MATTVNAIIKMRTGTAAALSTQVLYAGEPGYTTDTYVYKVGDGTTTFASLPAPCYTQVQVQTIINNLITKINAMTTSTFVALTDIDNSGLGF